MNFFDLMLNLSPAHARIFETTAFYFTQQTWYCTLVLTHHRIARINAVSTCDVYFYCNEQKRIGANGVCQTEFYGLSIFKIEFSQSVRSLKNEHVIVIPFD